MKTVLIAGSMMSIILSIQIGIHKQKHRVSDECCLAKKGKICGKYLKDCCRSDCDPGILGSKWCKEGDEYEPDCQTCTEVCKSKGGISCGASIASRKIACCPTQNCILPNEGEDIIDKMTDKFASAAAQKAEEAIKGGAKHNLMFDASGYLQSIDQMTITGKCEEGTEIELPKCIEDSFGALLFAKLFG